MHENVCMVCVFMYLGVYPINHLVYRNMCIYTYVYVYVVGHTQGSKRHSECIYIYIYAHYSCTYSYKYVCCKLTASDREAFEAVCMCTCCMASHATSYKSMSVCTSDKSMSVRFCLYFLWFLFFVCVYVCACECACVCV